VEHFGVLRERIEGLSISSRTDTEMLALAAARMAEIEECDAIIKEHGRVIETVTDKAGNTAIRANPAVAQRNEAMRHLQSLLAEFGLTPAARSKIIAPKKDKQANPFAKVSGSR
jgi:P27 family predicted phage terminase small subunit